ncbi:MAG: LysR substrate-binding domain-containing protein [Bilophila wadsworthia]
MGRGIRLNDKGRLLEERLAPLYNQLKNVLALVASDELAGKIRIGASTTLSDFVLPQVLYNFKMRHHQVEIECESENTADIVRHVEHGLLDVGFVEGDVHNLAVEITPRQGIPCGSSLRTRHWPRPEPYPSKLCSTAIGCCANRDQERGKRFCASLPRAACARRSF